MLVVATARVIVRAAAKEPVMQHVLAALVPVRQVEKVQHVQIVLKAARSHVTALVLEVVQEVV